MKTRRSTVTATIAAIIILAQPSLRAETMLTDCVASQSKETLLQALDYWEQHDMEAYNKLGTMGLLINLKKGTKVELLDSDILRMKVVVKVRPRGSIIGYWTLHTAVGRD